MEETLNERLTAAGYTTASAPGLYQKHILKDGEIIFTGDASEVASWLEPKPVPSIELLERIVNEHTYREVGWKDETPLLVDVTTANAMLTVYRALSSRNQARFASMIQQNKGRFCQLVDFCWEQVR